ncbi:6-phosphogluconate dehydrogenase C-terminal domain-like protein [Cenococcum geophilum 1.58]|uniref:6-phosphogluconate dehydrogenase C-terminal domain-like protein n=1 Tax=Cenococcum geophilum 1.58 TaxID=794803 RepID=UPI00358E82B4|nr:6-phosphogluconate dehydrogenase C-terminal domain-like protein [Cenococcum geophilum 1.58]
MALLFAENGLGVSLSDSSEQAMDKVIDEAKKDGFGERIKKFKDYKSLCASLSSPKLLIFSLPHGNVGDKVLEGLMPHLTSNAIILDCGNEHYANTEHRQAKCKGTGIHYLGVGVSSEYQAARARPSMCPGGDKEALNTVMPLLEQVAAKGKEGKPCVGMVGRGGAGHYVKMVHNGIEHGMMSAISEAWGIMRAMGMEYEEIGDVFGRWNESGELRGTYLISIGADLSHKRDSSNNLVLPTVADKVVQDITGEEGTGIWSNTEAIERHIPAPTLNAAHTFRLASAYLGDRECAEKTMGGGFPPQKIELGKFKKVQFLESLRKSVYTACLASFIQGLNAIDAANKEHKWEIDYAAVVQIWKAGCIIEADYISSEILAPVLTDKNRSADNFNLLFSQRAMQDVKKCFLSLRKVVAKCVETDQAVPALSASLEYFKIVTGTDLQTSFYGAELDYFGHHMFDEKGEEEIEGPTEGKHHYEWKPAKGVLVDL